MDPIEAERRKNYRRFIKNINTDYFELKYALFALNEFEDGVYHIQGEIADMVRGRLHHMIGLKIKNKLHIYDYAGDGGYKVPLLVPNKCIVKERNYEFCATKVQDIGLLAIYLGKIKDDFEKNK